MLSRIRHASGGASAVEFALLLPVLIILLFGIMYGASLLNSQQTVTQAAREGARFAATLPLSAFPGDDVPSGDWFDAVESRAQAVMASDRPLTMAGTDPSVCILFASEGGTEVYGDGCPNPPDIDGADDARVKVITARPARLELGITSVGPINLSSDATARFEGDVDGEGE